MRALITGITGQDGHYLSGLLKNLGYEVYGGYRRSTGGIKPDVETVPLEMTEFESIRRAIKKINPDEIYNLAAQSHVGESFECPEYTSNVNYLGILRILECIRETKIRLYQASTSEMFGGGTQLDEQSRFAPRSPYAVAKLAAHHECAIYRRAYGVRVSCGILFNHESPLRGKEFVTRKITYHSVRNLPFTLANVDSVRDWGHAADYVRAMQLMLQHEPDDFVVATGESHTIDDFIKEVKYCGVNPQYEVVEATERPWDVKVLEGNPSKAKEVLGWKPIFDFRSLVRDMVSHETAEMILNQAGTNPRRMTKESEVLIDLIRDLDDKNYKISKVVTDIGARLNGSNAYHLIEAMGFAGILCDMNQKHVNQLRQVFPTERVEQVIVSPENVNDYVLDSTGILLIDIDGNDYWVWKAVKEKPEIVVIECAKRNEDEILPYLENSPKRPGSGKNPIIELAKEKGYTFYKQVSVNLFFLRNDIYDLLRPSA